MGRKFSLASGKREVSVTVANSRGVESLPVRAVVNVKAAEGRPALFVLAVGVTKYRDHSLSQGVRFAAADAQTVAKQFETQGKGFFRKVETRTLQDQQATRANIEARMKELTDQARPEDISWSIWPDTVHHWTVSITSCHGRFATPAGRLCGRKASIRKDCANCCR